MRSLSWLVSSVLLAIACARAQPDAEEAARAEADHQRMLAQVEATHARYRAVLEAFLQALAARQPDAAYALLAPVYQHGVSQASFAQRIAHNENFAQAPPVRVLGTSSQAGLTKVRAVLGQLGLAEVSFVEGAGGPRISALTLAGAPALPLPQ